MKQIALLNVSGPFPSGGSLNGTKGGVKVNLFSLPDCFRASLVAQLVKNLPAMQETWVQSLGWEDLLKKEMATHSSMLAWKNPMDGGTW